MKFYETLYIVDPTRKKPRKRNGVLVKNLEKQNQRL
ncbi:hypothetical protein Ct9H90mP29_04980 [bacterium]|nr:MAG: hypothetical protein Ct9H90mP29_04980 [bacterium]